MKENLIEILGEGNVFEKESMKNHTSFKTGGMADFFVTVDSIDKLKKLLEYIKLNKTEYFIIGNGTNVLVKDNGFKGIIIKLEFDNIEIENKENEAIITLGSSCLLAQLRTISIENSLTGLEALVGIPGSIGGAIKMNAGAYGTEMKDVVIETKVLDEKGNIIILNNDEQKFSYRHSVFFEKKYIILETKIKALYGNKIDIENKITELLNSRKEKQPLEYPSAGSTFKRGKDFYTAKVIDECGLRGTKVGGAEVSQKHAGFIINKDNATTKDILDLIQMVKQTVFEKTGRKIELEIIVIGE